MTSVYGVHEFDPVASTGFIPRWRIDELASAIALRSRAACAASQALSLLLLEVRCILFGVLSSCLLWVSLSDELLDVGLHRIHVLDTSEAFAWFATTLAHAQHEQGCENDDQQSQRTDSGIDDQGSKALFSITRLGLRARASIRLRVSDAWVLVLGPRPAPAPD